MNKRKTGADREALAAEYLTARGMCVKERNFQSRQGEIDIIGYHDGCLVFVEVKYRRTEVCGCAAEAVDRRKQRRICRAADYYRYLHHLGDDCPVRYDVVAIQGTEISWIRNAFFHVYR
ncbi:MAG: YraN family protein [Acetatifactor sp.]|nr:YraN family protein [Acetatifactor sp.]MDE7043494.1 YraN family protein [Acetatifactor sp.]